MENLSDAEFGSDNKGKEAPILIAQRYLNIFRQIHIFNKTKRDEFDNELLNLEPEIVNLIRRMPGGQLLIKHMETVKTERGIAFEKINDDSTSTTDNEQSALSSSNDHPIVGGSVVIDASFAETLAKALAHAFKQIPPQTLPSANNAIPSNMSDMLEVMAKEIQMARVSFQDLLKETRSITDSAIASQASISKVLDSILSARKCDEIDLTDLNNRIIASQETITKLLENLHTPQNRSYNDKTVSLDIDDKLQALKKELQQDIERSIQQALKQHTPSASLPAQEEAEKIETPQFVDKSHLTTDNDMQIHFSPVATPTDDVSATPNPDKKKNKKKKKKKKNKQEGSAATLDVNSNPSTDFFANATPEVFPIVKETDNVLSVGEQQGAFNGVIKNEIYPYPDDFSHIDLNEPPLDDFSSENIDNGHMEAPVNSGIKESAEVANDFSGLDELADTGLDFELPKEESFESTPQNETPIQQVTDDFSGLDELADTGLDFELPQEESFESTPQSETPIQQVADDFSGLDELADTGLDFVLPQEESFESTPQNETPIQQMADDFSGLDELADTGLDFELPQEESFESTSQSETPIQQAADDFSGLDELADTGLDFELPQEDTFESTAQSEAPIQQVTDDFSGLDELADDGDAFQTSFSTASQPATEVPNSAPSRFSAELDRIRQALTSDNIDISSLDEPIALDDYQDDERLINNTGDIKDSFTPQVDVSNNSPTYSGDNSADVTDTNSSDEDWEWEYVDENGVPVEGDGNDEDWEWEYIEDDTPDTQKV